ncbi:MAG: hypothetical protein ACI9AX_002503 [Polaromonas sp.]
MAFTEAALTFDDFENAMRRKLLKELAVLAVSSIPQSDLRLAAGQ